MKDYSLGLGKKQALEILNRYSPGVKGIQSKFTWWCIFYKDEALALDYVQTVLATMQKKVDYQKRILSLDAEGKKELLENLSSTSELIPEKYVYVTWAQDVPFTEKVLANIKEWQSKAEYGVSHNWILCIPYPKDIAFFTSESYKWISLNSATVHILQGNKGEWSQWIREHYGCSGYGYGGSSKGSQSTCLTPVEQQWVIQNSEFHSLDVMNTARILAMIKTEEDLDENELKKLSTQMQLCKKQDGHVAYTVLYYIMEKKWQELLDLSTQNTPVNFMVYVLEDWFQLLLRAPKELTSTWKGELSTHNIPDQYHTLFMQWKEHANVQKIKEDIIRLSSIARLGKEETFWGLLRYAPSLWSHI